MRLYPQGRWQKRFWWAALFFLVVVGGWVYLIATRSSINAHTAIQLYEDLGIDSIFLRVWLRHRLSCFVIRPVSMRAQILQGLTCLRNVAVAAVLQSQPEVAMGTISLGNCESERSHEVTCGVEGSVVGSAHRGPPRGLRTSRDQFFGERQELSKILVPPDGRPNQIRRATSSDKQSVCSDTSHRLAH